MSNFVDAEGHFDHVGQKVIGTSEPVVVNGDKAEALWLLLADQKQTDLLFWGPSFCVIGGQQERQFRTTDGQPMVLGFTVPAFCDRLAFDVFALGTGDVTFGGSYTVSVNAEGTLPVRIPGSQTDNLLSVTNPNPGNSIFQKINIAIDTDVDLRCVIVRFLRSNQQLS